MSIQAPLRNRLLSASIAVAGAVALTAGCGGSGSSSSTTAGASSTGAPSADAFRSQADAVCRDANTQLNALTAPSDSSSAADVASYLHRGLTISGDELDRLRAITPPADLKDDYDSALDLLQRRDAQLETAADKIAGGADASQVIGAADARITSLNDQAKAKAKTLGLSVCGTDEGETATTSTATTATAPATDTTATTATTASTRGTSATSGTDKRFTTDLTTASGALSHFADVIRSGGSLSDLQAKVPTARADLQKFDRAITDLGRYTLDSPALEHKRAGIARTGHRVTATLERFLDAVAKGDQGAAAAVLPDLQSAITAFSSAATG
jgi:hypothetical protein